MCSEHAYFYVGPYQAVIRTHDGPKHHVRVFLCTHTIIGSDYYVSHAIFGSDYYVSHTIIGSDYYVSHTIFGSDYYRYVTHYIRF